MSTNTPIATQTLTSAAASVTFSSIPQGYTDLILVFAGTVGVLDNNNITFNGDAGSNYSVTRITGNGSAAGSSRGSNLNAIQCGEIATSQSNDIIQIQNYSNSTTYKTLIHRSNNTSQFLKASVGLWRNAAAITSITITNGGNFTTGSTFSIYGIQVGQAAQKAQGGNVVTTDGTYVYHTFTSSGSFIPNSALTVNYLVVAGGGGGGSPYGGAGGAGGLRCTVTATGGGGSLESALSLNPNTNYTITIGAGGAGGGNASGTVKTRGTNGANSIFSTITSDGGGGGGRGDIVTENNGLTGGSGGGAGMPPSVTATGGAGTANQGYAGGNTTPNGNPTQSTAGGGGAGAVGQNNISNGNGGNGGAGVATSISGSSVTYAGGGGGHAWIAGTKGLGQNGGGNGGITNGIAATSASANSGSGGGGGTAGSPSNIGGNGGSGIVVVRYLA